MFVHPLAEALPERPRLLGGEGRAVEDDREDSSASVTQVGEDLLRVHGHVDLDRCTLRTLPSAPMTIVCRWW